MLYTIQPGDTLGRIAQKFGTTLDALRRANPAVRDIDRIAVGQQLALPPSIAEATFPTTGGGVNTLPTRVETTAAAPDAAPASEPAVESAAEAAAGGLLAWGAKVSPEFRAKVRAVAAKIGCHASDLMACMAFESGETFSPSVRNRHSGATGLIQFMPATATKLGTTTETLAHMTAEAQLDYVAKYFKWFPGVRTLEDLYMAILWPRAIGKPNDYVLFAAPSIAYKQNKGLDKNKDGKVTKAEASSSVRAKLKKGLDPALVG